MKWPEVTLESRDFQYFVAVGEELHFQRASVRLQVAQPNLSQHIKRLEARLGVTLLKRTTRTVQLTPAGEEFLARSRFLLAQMQKAVAATHQAVEGQTGRISVGYTPTVARELLPSVLQKFKQRYPEVAVELTQANTEEQVKRLAQGVLNIGFVRLPVQTRRVDTQIIGQERLVAALPHMHALATRSALALEDLAGEDFVYFSPILGVEFQEHAISYCQRAGFAPKLVQSATDTESVLAYVAAGFGVAILPAYVSTQNHPRVVFHPLREIPAVVNTALAWSIEAKSQFTDAFREVVVEVAD